MTTLRFICLFSLAALTSDSLRAGAYHQSPLNQPADTNISAIAAAAQHTPLKRVTDQIYELGGVRFDKQTRTISFAASINMTNGLVEYAVVHSSGKVHESVLKTEVNAYDIHLARLLLGPPEKLVRTNAVPDLAGPRIKVNIRWTASGVEKQVPLEDLVSNTLTRAKMSRGDWVYNGSRVVEGAFLARRDGSLVAIISDPDALINNPRPGRDDDEIWTVNEKLAPPAGTPVQVTIELGIRQ